MITQRDDEILGTSHRTDPLGMLAIWSTRARDLVPHLTEQTVDVRGFQLLVEIFRLWEFYETSHPQHAGRLADFFTLVEQAFARTVGRQDRDWPLPGGRRVAARLGDVPTISRTDERWHLLGAQQANGLWGLYRGAARRAGLLDDAMLALSAETRAAANARPGLGAAAQRRLFRLIERALDGETVVLPYHMNNHLPRELYETFKQLPLRKHLRARLIKLHDLNRELASRLPRRQELNRRGLLEESAGELPKHRQAIENVVACENLISVVEGVFLWLCASKGRRLDAAAADLPVDLTALEAARRAFAKSGVYARATADRRQRRLLEQLETKSKVRLAGSVLKIHEQVSEERGRATWVWEEHGRLVSDMEVAKPAEADLQVGLAWRNDYYLSPLRNIRWQLADRSA